MNILNINSCKEIGILKKLLKKAIIKGIIPNDFNKASLFIKKNYLLKSNFKLKKKENQ